MLKVWTQVDKGLGFVEPVEVLSEDLVVGKVSVEAAVEIVDSVLGVAVFFVEGLQVVELVAVHHHGY